MVASDGRCRSLGVHTLPPNQEPTERWGFKLSKLTPSPLAILHLPVSPPNRATNWEQVLKAQASGATIPHSAHQRGGTQRLRFK